jgi:hypothetical protein
MMLVLSLHSALDATPPIIHPTNSSAKGLQPKLQRLAVLVNYLANYPSNLAKTRPTLQQYVHVAKGVNSSS